MGLLLLAATPLRALDAKPERCGFAVPGQRVESTSAGVPLLLASLAEDGDPRTLARRKRLLEGERACSARFPKTARYLRSIVARLVRGSRLEAFAARAPELEFVLDCVHPIPLPIAMATSGKLMLVPRALPALAASEDAIAAVLGHELAHLTLRHAEQLRAALAGAAGLEPSAALALKREHEREADITGLKLAVSAGYDPRAALEHMRAVDQLAAELERSGHPGVHDDGAHDGLAQRLESLDAQIRACGYPSAVARKKVPPDVKAELAAPTASGSAL